MTQEKPPDSVVQMQNAAARGAGWAIMLGMGARILSLVGSIVITYFINPDVMGEVGVAVIVVETVTAFTTFGQGHYMLSRPHEGPATMWHITVSHVGLGVLTLAATVLLQGPLATWMNSPTLGKYLPWMALAALLDRVAFVPERLLSRALRFRRVAVTRSAAELMYGVSSLTLAALGMGGMAVVLGNVARSSLRFLSYVSSSPRTEWLVPYRLSMAKYREIFAFGVPLALGGWVGMAAAKWDNLIIARLYGPELMGQYNVAYNLADVPADQIGEQAGEILLPSLARLQPKDRPQLAIFSMGMLAFIIFPVSVGLGMVATTAAHTLLRSNWGAVGPMLAVLSLLSIARPMAWQMGAYLQASGRTHVLLVLSIAKLALLVLLMFTVGRLGPLWACVAVGLAFIAHALALQTVVAIWEHVSFRALLGRCVRPLLACIPLGLAVLGAREALRAAGLDVRGVGLTVEVIAGVVGYVVGAWVFARHQTKEFLTLVREARKKRDA